MKKRKLTRRQKTLEWTKCILSPKHAKKTYLLISPRKERRTLLLLRIAVIAIFIGAILMWMLAAYRYGQLVQMRKQQRPHEIHIRMVPEGPQQTT